MDKPLLSICIPTYNRSAELKGLLAMLQSELDGVSFHDYEIFVSDNCSVDETRQVCMAFAGACELRKFVYNCHPKNIGADANFEFLLANAGGRHLVLLGDDDAVLPGRLVNVLNLLRVCGENVSICINPSEGVRSDSHEAIRVSSAEALSLLGTKIFFLSSTIIPSRYGRISFPVARGTFIWQAYVFAYSIAHSDVTYFDDRPFVTIPLNERVSYDLPSVIVSRYGDFIAWQASLPLESGTVVKLRKAHFDEFLVWAIISRKIMAPRLGADYAKAEMASFKAQIISVSKVPGITTFSLLRLRAVHFCPSWVFRFVRTFKLIIFPK